jgi:PIN domain nuclease of toxin-antitoxin system
VRAFLDTQALLWFGTGDRRMPVRSRRFIEDSKNELLLSIASVWEIMIKARLGRFQLDQPAPAYVLRYIGQLGLVPTGISLDHAFRVATLPEIHQDPFDRVLIAQAMTEGIPIVTGDDAISRYNVRTIW